VINEGVDLSFCLGKEYYIDPVTKESQWEHPSLTAGKSSSNRRSAAGSEQVQVLHILVKHIGSRNPKNYKGETITRSKDEARRRLDGTFLVYAMFFSDESTYRYYSTIKCCRRSAIDLSTNC
jgi:hypothetical protein